MKKLPFSFGFGFADTLKSSKSKQKNRGLTLQQATGWSEGIILKSPISKKRLGETINTEFSTTKLLPVYLVSALIFIALFTRLISLQLIEGPIFLSKAQGNGVRIKTIHAPRGVVYDRNGLVLARNRPAFRVAWDLSQTPKEKREAVKKSLLALLKINPTELDDKIKVYDEQASKSIHSDEPLTVKNDVDRDTILQVETREKELPGIITETLPVREYPFGEAAANILGYTGEISSDELKKEEFANYKVGDQLGKDGVEKQFENKIKGQDGSELLKVDSIGSRLGTVYTSPPLAGGNLTLSIDAKLQQKVYETLKKAVDDHNSPGGSVVISDPKTGEILALVSYPSFDNNLFAKGISGKEYATLINDARNPLINRPIESSYPPGSTFKIITAISGLETGKISSKTVYEDTGKVTLGPITFNNWYFTQYGRKEGPVDVVKALQRSNDTFFYLSAPEIGEKNIQDFAFKFGLGSELGINLPGETTGLVPTEDWKWKVRNEPWYPGNTLNMAIGQGDLLTSPLQINSMTEVIANGGSLLKPTLVKNDPTQVLRSNIVGKENLELIKKGMEAVVNTGGTAWPFFGFKIQTAGKTGTAESSSEKPHGWYTAFAPVEDPQLTVTVMLEKAGEGSNVAAPVAKDIMNWWFFDRLGKPIPQASTSAEKIGD